MTYHEPPNAYVSQLTLKVSNLVQSIAFYEHVLGMQTIEYAANCVHLGVSDNRVLLTLVQQDQVTSLQSQTTGLYHFAILLPTRAALAQIAIHLSKCAIRYGSSDHLVSEALYLSDPDGNGIELYRDRPSDEWHWNGNQVAMTVDPLRFDDLMRSAPVAEWSGMPKGTIIGHIHLHVSNIAQSERFYCDGLQFEVVNRYGAQALFLSSGKYHHHIGVNTWQGVGAPSPLASSVGLAHFTVVYPDEQMRQRVLERLKKMDAPLIVCDHDYETVDPAGNVIQIEIYREGR